MIDTELMGANLQIELGETFSHILDVELNGCSGGSTKTFVHINDTAYWNSKPNFVGEKGHIYVYTDASHDVEENPIPGIKIGDGSAYLIDNPFVSSDHATLIDHIHNQIRHITAEERAFWNNKVRCDETTVNEATENITFTKL